MADIPKCDIMALQIMTANELRAKHQELFGNPPESKNRKFLERKIAYRMQEAKHSRISLVVQAKIQQLIELYDPINKVAAKTKQRDSTLHRDSRLPIPGSFITKVYKGKRIEVKVLENGFEFEGTIYKNLSAVAKAITGDHWNGFIFFGFGHGKR